MMNARAAKELMLARRDGFDRALATVRNMADSAVRLAAGSGKHAVTVQVPRSIFGFEPFDQVEMGRALANQLFSDGFRVSGSYLQMTISWGEPTPYSAPPENRKSGDKKEKKKAKDAEPAPAALIKIPRPRRK